MSRPLRRSCAGPVVLARVERRRLPAQAARTRAAGRPAPSAAQFARDAQPRQRRRPAATRRRRGSRRPDRGLAHRPRGDRAQRAAIAPAARSSRARRAPPRRTPAAAPRAANRPGRRRRRSSSTSDATRRRRRAAVASSRAARRPIDRVGDRPAAPRRAPRARRPTTSRTEIRRRLAERTVVDGDAQPHRDREPQQRPIRRRAAADVANGASGDRGAGDDHGAVACSLDIRSDAGNRAGASLIVTRSPVEFNRSGVARRRTCTGAIACR